MHTSESDDNPYLLQEVLSASPLKLRLLLIQRAESLCAFVRELWGKGDDLQAAGWLLRIREILGELLDGIKDKGNPVSRQVSDFYVYLLQLLTRIEITRDEEKLTILEELLHIENETWQQVVSKATLESSSDPGAAFPSAMPHGLDTSHFPQSDLPANNVSQGGFSLEI